MDWDVNKYRLLREYNVVLKMSGWGDSEDNRVTCPFLSQCQPQKHRYRHAPIESPPPLTLPTRLYCN